MTYTTDISPRMHRLTDGQVVCTDSYENWAIINGVESAARVFAQRYARRTNRNVSALRCSSYSSDRSRYDYECLIGSNSSSWRNVSFSVWVNRN